MYTNPRNIDRPYGLTTPKPTQGFIGRAISFALLGILVLAGAASTYAQMEIVTPKDSTVSMLHSQAVTVKGLPYSSIDLYMNGKLIKTSQVRVDGLVDFLNLTVPSGDVQFDITTSGSQVVSSPERTRHIHIVGPPTSVKIGIASSAVSADGASLVNGTVRGFDEWGYPVQTGMVTIGVDSGKIVTADTDPNTMGIQIAINDGVASFEYRAASNAGTATFHASMGDVTTEGEIDLNTTSEPFTMVGLATGTGGQTTARSSSSVKFPDDAFPDGFEKSGRFAMYARGTVAKDYLLTASFDSDRRNQNRFFRDLDPDFLYSIYGDNSMLYYDAQSTRNAYAKIQRNQSYLLYGDYNTDLTKQEFTLYNRTFHGGKLYLKDKNWNLTGFGTLTDRQVVQMEMRGTGLSGFYNLNDTRVTPGSEKVRIETRDRFHSEVVLHEVDRYRFSDYEIDYEQGTIYFKQPVPAMDAYGNPTYIVVTYEAISNTANSYIAGGRIENTMLKGLTVGVTGVTEEQQPQNYVLMGGDVKYNYNNVFSLGGELGHSSILGTPGTAYKVETSVSPISAVGLRSYYRKVEPGFFNITQSGSQRELGTEKFGGGATIKPFTGSRLNGDYYESKQNTAFGTTKVNSLTGTYEQQIVSALSVNVGVEDLKYQGVGFDTTKGRIETHSTLLRTGLGFNVSDNFKLSAFNEQNIGSDNDMTKPNGTSIVGEYKVSSAVSISGSQKFYQDGGGLSTLGLMTQPMEGTNVYGKYELGEVMGGYRNMLSIGLRNQLKLPYDLTANFGYERAKSLVTRLIETGTQDHTAYSASLEYLPKMPLKVAAKGEYGEDNISRKTNLDFGADYRVLRDLGVFAKYRHTQDHAEKSAGYEIRNHLITGLAYRPVDVNWFNMIGKYEWKTDNNQYLNPFRDLRNQIVSVHAYVEPIERWESGVKFAFRLSNEVIPQVTTTSHTYFYLFHTKYDLTKWLDLGGEYRLLLQTEARDKLDGYSVEMGVTAIKNFRVAGGYNFKGYKDLDLVDYAVWSKGPFVRVDLKFTEEIFDFLSHNKIENDTESK